MFYYFIYKSGAMYFSIYTKRIKFNKKIYIFQLTSTIVYRYVVWVCGRWLGFAKKQLLMLMMCITNIYTLHMTGSIPREAFVGKSKYLFCYKLNCEPFKSKKVKTENWYDHLKGGW